MTPAGDQVGDDMSDDMSGDMNDDTGDPVRAEVAGAEDAAIGRGSARPTKGARGWVGVVAAVALVLLGALAWQLVAARADAADRDARVEVAGDFALALLAYDHADLDATLAAVTAVSTDRFADGYRERFTAELADPIRELGVIATAEIVEVFLAVDPADVAATDVERTRVLVGAEVEVTVDGEVRPSAPTLELELVRTADGWRVDDAGGTGRGGLPPPG